MDIGLELTHTVTTTINADRQTVVNETELTDGAEVVLKNTQMVSLQTGKTYNIEAKGDINGNTIKRLLNVANNLVGVNAFTYEDSNDATDTETVVFSAKYDVALMVFSGTAPVDSMIRILLEDGSGLKTIASSAGVWSLGITEDQLEFGDNQIFVVNGVKDADIITLTVNRERPDEPFKDGFAFELANDGLSVTGTVVDSRATVYIDVDGESFTALPTDNLSWSFNFNRALMHNSLVSVSVGYNGTMSQPTTTTYYKNSAQLDQVAGQTVTGTAVPLSAIKVTTTKYGEQNTTANGAGIWEVDFETGLPADAVVKVEINSVALTDLTYTGPADFSYQFTAEVVDAMTVRGLGTAGESITVTPSGFGEPVIVTVDQTNNWTATLNLALENLESVSVNNGEKVITAMYLFFDAQIITATQLSGIAQSGTTVSVGESSTLADSSNHWTLILPNSLGRGEAITVLNGDDSIDLTYTIPFNAYLSDDGVRVFGTTSQADVSINVDGVDHTISGLDAIEGGTWSYDFETPLAMNEMVSIQSGSEFKVLTYTGSTTFSAVLNPDLNAVTVSTTTDARIRITFADLSIVEKLVPAGDSVIELGRTLDAGDEIGVACIALETTFKTVTIVA